MSAVVLPCHVQGRPLPTVTWTKGGAKLGARGGSYRVLPTGEYIKTSHLHILLATTEKYILIIKCSYPFKITKRLYMVT